MHVKQVKNNAEGPKTSSKVDAQLPSRSGSLSHSDWSANSGLRALALSLVSGGLVLNSMQMVGCKESEASLNPSPNAEPIQAEKMPVTLDNSKDHSTGSAQSRLGLAPSNEIRSQRGESILRTPAMYSNALPSSIWVATHPMINPETGIEYSSVNVAREDPLRSSGQSGAEARSNHYYQFPLPMWEERSNEVESTLPSTIHRVVGPAPDGTYQVTMYMAMTSVELRQLLGEAVMAKDAAYATQNGDSKIVMHFWPLTHSVVLAFDQKNQRQIAFAITGDLNSARRLEANLIVAGHDLPRFIEGIGDGSIQFTPYFQGRLIENTSGRISVRASSQLREQVSGQLSSEQLSGDAPIFQRQAQEVAQNVSESISRTVLGDAELVKSLSPADLFGRLFYALEATKIDTLMNEFQDLHERYNEFIRPHLEAFQEEKARQGVTITIEEQVKTVGRSRGSGFSFLGFGSSSSRSVSESDLRRLEQLTGVSFQRSESGTSFAPHSISVSRLKEGWQTIDLDVNDSIFRSLGPDYSYIPGPSLSGTYTYSRAMASLGLPGQRTASYEEERNQARENLEGVLRNARRDFLNMRNAEATRTERLLRSYSDHRRDIRNKVVISGGRSNSGFVRVIGPGSASRRVVIDGREVDAEVMRQIGQTWDRKVKTQQPEWSLDGRDLLERVDQNNRDAFEQMVVQHVRDLTVSHRRYEDERRELIQSEFDEYKKKLNESREGRRLLRDGRPRPRLVPSDDWNPLLPRNPLEDFPPHRVVPNHTVPWQRTVPGETDWVHPSDIERILSKE